MYDKKCNLCDADKAVSKATITHGCQLINFDNFRVRKSEHFQGFVNRSPSSQDIESVSQERESPDEEIHADLGAGGQASLWSAKVREIINIS